MLFNLYEKDGKYANKNLINANIVHEDGSLDCRFHFGKEYVKTFGKKLFKKFTGKPLIEIKLQIDDSYISELMVDENDDIFDKNSSEYDPLSLFTPLASETPERYKYRMSAFYVLVRDFIETKEEKEFFRGIGHSLMCWVLSEANLPGDSIFAIEASGDEEQDGLVNYYKKLGFKTCADLSIVPKKWYDSSVASSICMYSTIDNLKKICQLNKRTFTDLVDNPFKSFRSL